MAAAIQTMSSEGQPNESDLDEKCIPSSQLLFNYQVKHRLDLDSQSNYTYNNNNNQDSRSQRHSMVSAGRGLVLLQQH